MIQINLEPTEKDLKTYGPLAYVSEEARKRILNLPFGETATAIEGLEIEILHAKFKGALFRELSASGGSKGRTAEALGYSATGLYKKIKQEGLTDDVNEFCKQVKQHIKNTRRK